MGPNVLDDTEKIISPSCWNCKHLTGYRECVAFKEIPLEIWNNPNQHREEYEGDNGIQFEPED